MDNRSTLDAVEKSVALEFNERNKYSEWSIVILIIQVNIPSSHLVEINSYGCQFSSRGANQKRVIVRLAWLAESSIPKCVIIFVIHFFTKLVCREYIPYEWRMRRLIFSVLRRHNEI